MIFKAIYANKLRITNYAILQSLTGVFPVQHMYLLARWTSTWPLSASTVSAWTDIYCQEPLDITQSVPTNFINNKKGTQQSTNPQQWKSDTNTMISSTCSERLCLWNWKSSNFHDGLLFQIFTVPNSVVMHKPVEAMSVHKMHMGSPKLLSWGHRTHILSVDPENLIHIHPHHFELLCLYTNDWQTDRRYHL